MIGKIRRLHRRDKLSEREIARKMGLARTTVSKWLKGEAPEPPKYVRGEQPSKLAPFHSAITQASKARCAAAAQGAAHGEGVVR